MRKIIWSLIAAVLATVAVAQITQPPGGITGNIPSASTTGNNIFSGNNSFTGTNTFSNTNTVASPEPRWLFRETDQGADLKLWDIDTQSGVLCIRTRTDADGAGLNVLCTTRGTTTNLTNISVGNTTSNPTFTFLGGGTISFLNVASLTGGGTFSVPKIGLIANSASPADGFYNSATHNVTVAVNTTNEAVFNTSGITFGEATNNPPFTFAGTGSVTINGSTLGQASVFANVLVNSSSIPGGAGIYRPSAGVLGFACSTGLACGNIDGNKSLNVLGAVTSTGTKPTVTGCSNSSTLGGAIGGSYVSGTTGTCTVTITLPTGPTNGYACFAHDDTTAADYTQSAIVTSTTTLTISGTTVTADKIVWGCSIAY